MDADITNFKGVTHAQLTAEGGHMAIVCGPNGAGKSSVLDGIAWALVGPKAMKDLTDPVRHGADEAKVKVSFDGPNGLSDWIIARTQRPGQPPKLTVKAGGANLTNPAAVVADLVSNLTFDPLSLSRLSPARQREEVLKHVEFTVDPATRAPFDLDGIEQQYQAAYDARRDAKRDLEALVARFEAMPEPDADAPTEAVSIAELSQQLSEAMRTNQRNTERRVLLDRQRTEADNLRMKLAEVEAYIEQNGPEVDALEDVDTDAISAAMAAAQETNAVAAAALERQRLADDVDNAQAVVDHFQRDIDLAAARKAKALGEARMPVAGIGFSDDGVTLNGVPLGQVNDAALIDFAFRFSLAGHPAIRLVLIRNGSLLDDESMARIEAACQELDAIAIVERVGTADADRAALTFTEAEDTGSTSLLDG